MTIGLDKLLFMCYISGVVGALIWELFLHGLSKWVVYPHEKFKRKEHNMPKAILEFQLPEENNEFKLAQRGSDYWTALWDIDQDLRGWLKHGHEFKSAGELMEHLRKDIRERADIDDIE